MRPLKIEVTCYFFDPGYHLRLRCAGTTFFFFAFDASNAFLIFSTSARSCVLVALRRSTSAVTAASCSFVSGAIFCALSVLRSFTTALILVSG